MLTLSVLALMWPYSEIELNNDCQVSSNNIYIYVSIVHAVSRAKMFRCIHIGTYILSFEWLYCTYHAYWLRVFWFLHSLRIIMVFAIATDTYIIIIIIRSLLHWLFVLHTCAASVRCPQHPSVLLLLLLLLLLVLILVISLFVCQCAANC